LALAHLPAFVVGSRGMPVFAFCAIEGAVKAVTETNTIHPKRLFRKTTSLKYFKMRGQV
jgi:hypothetical protein